MNPQILLLLAAAIDVSMQMEAEHKSKQDVPAGEPSPDSVKSSKSDRRKDR